MVCRAPILHKLFFLRAHHNVDVMTKPCKLLWSLQQATKTYTNQTNWCATGIVWGSTPICKMDGEGNGCSYVNTSGSCGAIEPPTPPSSPPTQAPTEAPTSSSELMVQCGIALPPTISPWAMGKCGVRTTADPRVFGPFTWPTLHRFAEHFPLEPSNDTQNACVNFVNALPFMLPCPHCGYDFSHFIVGNIVANGTFDELSCAASITFHMPCLDVETSCSSRINLISFFLRAHHTVDTHTKPCKPLWSSEESAGAYLFQPNFCATGIVNGDYKLCRGGPDDSADCVHVSSTSTC